MQVFNPEEMFKLLILGWWGVVDFSLGFFFFGWLHFVGGFLFWFGCFLGGGVGGGVFFKYIYIYRF